MTKSQENVVNGEGACLNSHKSYLCLPVFFLVTSSYFLTSFPTPSRHPHIFLSSLTKDGIQASVLGHFRELSCSWVSSMDA